MHKAFVSVTASVFLLVACAGNEPSAQTASSPAGNAAIGAGCHADHDCMSGLFCEKDDPGGQCLKKCSTTADCGAGAICTDEKKCYQACQKPSDCSRPGYACKGAAPNMFCDTAAESSEHH